MPKNTFGGNKTKSYARKGKEETGLRLSTCEEEFYVIVTKILGGNICKVIDKDNNSYQCHIRGKFSSKNKFSNLITSGSILLVGKREWERPPIKNCDVLEIYDYNQLKFFERYPHDNTIILKLLSLVGDKIQLVDDSIFSFSDTTQNIVVNVTTAINTEKEEINFDDL
jgi:hypothetical protein